MIISAKRVRFDCRVGQILVDQDDKQWRISDWDHGFYVIEPLSNEERVKPEFIHSQCQTTYLPEDHGKWA